MSLPLLVSEMGRQHRALHKLHKCFTTRLFSPNPHTGYHTEYRKQRKNLKNNSWIKEEIRGKSRYLPRQTKRKHNKLTLGCRRCAKSVSEVVNNYIIKENILNISTQLKTQGTRSIKTKNSENR